uniref:Uncharacterized protein n=1 Tax=Anguilla anguilla TaxID=7936 RepID=A0A0E9TWV9_ANGAN
MRCWRNPAFSLLNDCFFPLAD